MFKSFFANQGLGADFSEVSAWAKKRGYAFKRERDGHGFVVDGKLDDTPWRIEWGPPQRPYIVGHELRIRMELGLPPDLQMLLISKTLMETLEKQAFEQFTESNQTEMGDATPEEREPRDFPSGGDMVWFRLSVGRAANADPKWLIPLICRRGHVTKKDIGSIRIFDRETKFEIARDAVDRFTAAMNSGPPQPIRIEAAGAPSAPDARTRDDGSPPASKPKSFKKKPSNAARPPRT